MNKLLAAVVALVLAAGLFWAWKLTYSVPRADDLEYIRWALRIDSVPELLRDHPPFPGWRYLNVLTWWLCTQADGHTGGAAAVVTAGLWWLALLTWMGWARSRSGLWGAAFVGLMMLATPWFRDLPTWRSWMTTIGEVLFLGAALWAMERERPRIAALAALLAVGFKEPAAFVLVPAALLIYRQPLVALCAGAPAVVGVLKMLGYEQEHASVVDNIVFYAVSIGENAAAVAAALATLHPEAAAAGLLGRAAPALAGGLVVAVCLGWSLRTREGARWAACLAPVLLLPLVYPSQNPVYLTEALLILSVHVAGALASSRQKPMLLLVLVVAAHQTMTASVENQQWQQRQWAVARQLQATLQDAPVGAVYLADDAADGARYVAHWLIEARGWTAAATPLPDELTPGLSVE